MVPGCASRRWAPELREAISFRPGLAGPFLTGLWDRGMMFGEGCAMGAVEDVLNILQNVVAPSLKSLEARISGLERAMETSERHTAERINDLRADVSARLEAMRGMMEAELGAMRGEMETKLGAMRSEMEAKLGSIRNEMDAFRNEVRAEIRSIRALVEPGPQEPGPHPQRQAMGR